MEEQRRLNLEEYDKKMEEYQDRLAATETNAEWDEVENEMSKFQTEFMSGVLEDYKKTIDCAAKQWIYTLLEYAVKVSENGSSIAYVETKETADLIEEILWEEIGDYLLDCEIYPEKGEWVIDCMFGGNYVPYWDGWKDQIEMQEKGE